MFETKVYDDVIDEHLQNIIEIEMMRADWTFLKDVSGATNSEYPSYGFVHVMKHPDHGIITEKYATVATRIFDNINNKLKYNFKEIYYTRSFLQLPLAKEYMKPHNGIHVDVPIPHIACVYYVNDSDGDTIIYENTYGTDTKAELIPHTKVTPKKGRMVFFDGYRYHCSSQPSRNHRCIVNFDLLLGE